jgi:hypothetical protein
MHLSKITEDIVLLHSNASPHATHSVQNQKWYFLKYPAYSLESSTCDFHDFAP